MNSTPRQCKISKLRSGLGKRSDGKAKSAVAMTLLNHLPSFPSFSRLPRDSFSSVLSAQSLRKAIHTGDKIFVMSKRFKLAH